MREEMVEGASVGEEADVGEVGEAIDPLDQGSGR